METLSVKEFEKRVEDFSQRTTTEALGRALYAIGEMMESKIHESFERERDPFDRAWKPLKQATLKRKRGRGRILYDTGALSFKWSVTQEGSSVRVASNVRSAKGYAYAKAHQFGTRHTPARPFIPARNGRLEGRLKREIEEYLKRAFGF